jgi:hypothetical protein
MTKWIAILLGMFTVPPGAQWLNYPEVGTPRTKDGKPNLNAPAPRTNGKSDLSGVWQAERTPRAEWAHVLGDDRAKIEIDLYDVTKEAMNVFWALKPEEEPLRPEALALMKQRRGQAYPPPPCLPHSVPMDIFLFTFKMIQARREIVIIPEVGDPPRQIYTDSRGLPKDDPQPSWMGYSVGRWEGDTLAVETAGFNDEGRLDAAGHPRSESTHVWERYHRRDFGHMDLEVTIEDPKYYTRPIVLKTQLNLIPDSDVIEFVCTENEKDRAHTEKH